MYLGALARALLLLLLVVAVGSGGGIIAFGACSGSVGISVSFAKCCRCHATSSDERSSQDVALENVECHLVLHGEASIQLGA